jgi:hypothetical protein
MSQKRSENLRTEHLGCIDIELVGNDSGNGGKKEPQNVYVSVSGELDYSFLAQKSDRG